MNQNATQVKTEGKPVDMAWALQVLETLADELGNTAWNSPEWWMGRDIRALIRAAQVKS